MCVYRTCLHNYTLERNCEVGRQKETDKSFTLEYSTCPTGIPYLHIKAEWPMTDMADLVSSQIQAFVSGGIKGYCQLMFV
jgi:hypothetical protein